MISDRLLKLDRAFEFGRRISVAKLTRRAELMLRRQLRDRFARDVVTRANSVVPRGQPPLPLFPGRGGMLRVDSSAIAFTFIGRSETLKLAEIDWGAPGPQAENQLWRMNLHYMEYLEEADDALFQHLVLAWIDANPASRPRAWKDSWNSYALSIRTVVWMQQLAVRGDRLPPEFVRRCEASLAAQLAFLRRNLETDIGGNHLVKNIKALVWASAFFEGADADKWRRTAIDLLAVELPTQILDDGGHYERSPSYHCQVFADLLECRRALGPGALDGLLDERLRKMAQVSVDLAHPDGAVCLFNDAGLTMAYSPAACLSAYERLGGQAPARRPIFGFESAGYFGLRSDRSYFVADCGRLAPEDLPAHGHGDALSFEWSVDGARVVVDQGVYEYIDGERRRRSRSAASHNTLCFEGADQADFFGSFRCGRRPDVAVLSFATDGERMSLEGTHDGFKGLPGAPRHVRRFEVGPGDIMIRDRIEGRPDRPASVGFLLHPEVEVTFGAEKIWLRRGGTRIEATSTLPIKCESAVWWPDMGCERPTKRLTLCFPVGVKEALTTLRLAESGEEPKATDEAS